MDAARLYGQGMAFPPRVQPDGSIAIPSVLQPYMGGKTKIG